MKRTVAGLVAMCLVAAACGASEEADPATELPDGVRPSDGALIDAAFGGTQTVQDFVIHIDLSVHTEDGPVSLIQEVLDQAAEGAGEPVDLAGGFTFASVDSIAGDVTDAEGQTLPTISLDFALLTPTRELLDLTVEQVTQGAETVESLNVEPHPLLVEIVTADFSRVRRHLGPGDPTNADLTFVSAIEPGDDLRSVYLFGQTLPGDPQVEQGMSPHELLAYRWNLGLIRILGNEEGPSLVVDDSVQATDGSTKMTRENKEVLLGLVGASGFVSAVTAWTEQFYSESVGEFPTQFTPEPGSVLRVGKGTAQVCTGGINCEHINLEQLLAYQGALHALKSCKAVAAVLNVGNASGGVPFSALAEALSPPTSNTTSGEDSTTTTQESLADPPPPGPVSCDGGDPDADMAGGTFGDVHLTLFDGLSYSNQAVGEFLIFDNGSTQVQMRQEPWPGSDAVSVMTAAAVSVGDHAVSMHVNGELWIDDLLVELELGDTIAIGDAELLYGLFGWLIVLPDMTEVQVDQFDDNMVLTVKPKGGGTITGMLGDADGNPDNDLVTRDGQQLDSDAHTFFESFYPTYVDTWRISEVESLFHYAPDEGTDSFLIDGFPQIYATIEELTPEQRAEAERICRELGLTREDLLPLCILDVGLTGDPVFAYQAFIIEDRTSPPEAPAQVGATGESRLQVGELSLELGADTGTWQCEATPDRFWALTGIREGSDLCDMTVEYLDAATSDTGEEKLTMTLFLNGTPHAWMWNWLDPPTGTIESLTMNGSSLTVSGTAFVNDPLDPISPAFPLPAGSELVPFSLEATCDG